MLAVRLSRPGRWLTALAIAALALAALPAVGTGPAVAYTNCSVSDTFDSQEKEFLRLINNYRAQNGKPALTASVNLNRSAAWMAKDMATKRYFSHTDSLGRSSSKRITDCDGRPYTGENIAAGTVKDTAAEAFEMWRNSSGHNANMLNASYKQIGIARYYDASAPYRWYWVTDFSTTNDGTNAGGSSTGGSSGGSSGTTSPTPTPNAQSTKATMISPTNGATLSTSQRFTWTSASGARGYFFYMGTAPGSSNLVAYDMNYGTSLTVNGIPRTGQTVYVRLWTETASGWQYNDYTYRFPR